LYPSSEGYASMAMTTKWFLMERANIFLRAYMLCQLNMKERGKLLNI
jgi:hypothetical protein